MFGEVTYVAKFDRDAKLPTGRSMFRTLIYGPDQRSQEYRQHPEDAGVVDDYDKAFPDISGSIDDIQRQINELEAHLSTMGTGDATRPPYDGDAYESDEPGLPDYPNDENYLDDEGAYVGADDRGKPRQAFDQHGEDGAGNYLFRQPVYRPAAFMVPDGRAADRSSGITSATRTRSENVVRPGRTGGVFQGGVKKSADRGRFACSMADIIFGAE